MGTFNKNTLGYMSCGFDPKISNFGYKNNLQNLLWNKKYSLLNLQSGKEKVILVFLKIRYNIDEKC